MTPVDIVFIGNFLSRHHHANLSDGLNASEKGTASMTISASTALPELKESNRKMMKSVSGTTMASRDLARSR